MKRPRDRAHDWEPWQLVPACEYGPAGYCTNGQHHMCAHRPGGGQEDGVVSPECYLTWPNGDCVRGEDARIVEVGPWHIWRCPCECHTREPAGQLGFDLAVA